MRTYQFTRTSENPIMPLLMACTNPSRIQEAEDETPMMYDPLAQKIEMDMRVVGTKCLKCSTTKYRINRLTTSSKPDQKNAIDDSKAVK